MAETDTKKSTNLNTILAVGGVAALGGLAWYFLKKGTPSLDDLYKKTQSDMDKLDALITDYEDEVHALWTEINSYAESGVAITAAQQQHMQVEEAKISAKEAKIKAAEDAVRKDIGDITGAGGTPPTSPEPWVYRITEGLGLPDILIPVMEAVGIGALAFWLVTWALKRWRDTHGPPPSGTLPTGEGFSGDIVDAARADAEAKLELHTVDPTMFSVVVPAAQAIFATLPYWVRNEITTEAGIEAYQGSWTPYFAADPSSVYAVIAAGVAATILVGVLAPELLPAIGDFNYALAGALI